MSAPAPIAYVKAHLHGGPRDGETINMPWARIDVPMARWDGDVMVTDLYRLKGVWFGQEDAQYDFVDPAEPVAPVPLVECLSESQRGRFIGACILTAVVLLALLFRWSRRPGCLSEAG